MKRLAALIAAVAGAVTLVSIAPVAAQQVMNSAPQPAAAAPALPALKDVAYPGGTITLEVDATDLARRIFNIRQTIPVAKAGPLTLMYAQWIPGNHAPRGPIYNYAGLTITANGKEIPWRRDYADVYAFHVDVPGGAKSIQVEAAFLSAIEPAQGPVMMTPEMLRLNWYIAALYPAGHYARKINVDVSVKLPEGWDYATSLETKANAGGWVRFDTETLETVMDSPLFAGKFMRKFELDPGGKSRVTLNVMGDTAAQVDARPEIIEVHRNLIRQSDKLFGGARHFDHYDFLMSVSDKLATAGTEHQRSSDNGVRSGYFTAWDTGFVSKDLLAHEYVHSWNGKYRRPADLWTPSYNVPMRNSLLWAYEGQTQYWGHVLAARAGFVTKDQALDLIANNAATYATRTGRDWRPLADTTMDPIIAARRSLPWHNWQRSEDYYSEGQLIWMDADTLIREKSGGKRSLDDFAKAFFGMNDGDWGQLTYTRKDLVTALNRIEPHDWEAFFAARVDAVTEAPLAGLERGGYRLVWSDAPNKVWADGEARSKAANLLYSIGLAANAEGKVTLVQWDGPAWKAAITTATAILRVNGQPFSSDRLRAAVAGSKDKPVELQLRSPDATRTVTLDYNGGHRYPKLERIAGKPAYLDDILAPR